MIILLLISSIPVLLTGELTCGQQFPITESVDILKKLITKYAVPVIKEDKNGTEWLNYLIEKNEGLLIDGTRYFLNDDRFSPQMTFSFDNSLQLNSVPIFVVQKEQLIGWRPDFPDKAYALTRISHLCEVGQTACGLLCCHGEIEAVQKGFIQQDNDGNLFALTNYTFNGIVYSLQSNDDTSSSSCSYSLSHYDILFRRAEIAGQEISTIYFSCPESSNCCGLKCVPSPETAQLRKPREATLFSMQMDRQRMNVMLSFGAAISLIGFIVITFINYRSATASTRHHYERTKQHFSLRTTHTQTSRFSLHGDIQEVQKLLTSVKHS